jgi:acyl-CoA dehydrogenase
MNFDIPEEMKILTKEIRRFVEKEIDPISDEIERNGKIPDDLIRKMKELGFFGFTIPQEYGGGGLSILEQCMVYEVLGRTNSCIRTYIGSNSGPGVECIIADGTEDQKRKYLPRLAKGDIIAAFAVSEPNTGSDISEIQTIAEKKNGCFTLNGTKFYITMGDVANVYIALAYTDKKAGVKEGMTLFIVERGFSGFSIGAIDDKMGLRGSNTCEIILDNCVVPEENLIGRIGNGFKIALKGIDAGRLAITAVAVGAASKLLDLAIEYSKNRKAFSKSISDFQAIKFKLADMATDIYAAKMMMYNAAWTADQGKPAIKEISMAKVFSTEMANRVAYETLQIHGGMGYMKDLGIERMYRDVRVLTIYEGTSEIQRLTIAQQLLK